MEYVKLYFGLYLMASSVTILARLARIVRFDVLSDYWAPLSFYSAIFALGGVLIKSAL